MKETLAMTLLERNLLRKITAILICFTVGFVSTYIALSEPKDPPKPKIATQEAYIPLGRKLMLPLLSSQVLIIITIAGAKKRKEEES